MDTYTPGVFTDDKLWPTMKMNNDRWELLICIKHARIMLTRKPNINCIVYSKCHAASKINRGYSFRVCHNLYANVLLEMEINTRILAWIGAV